MKNETLLVSQAALLGDRDAFGRLVEAYQSPVRRFFHHLTGGDRERSKDLAQETFVKAWLHIGSFRAAAAFSTWLYRIAYNVFYDDCRMKRDEANADEAPEEAAVSDGGVSGSDLSIDLARALSTLSAVERTAVLLFYMEDKPVEKIAAIMGCPAGTVKSHLHRGRTKMSAYLKNEGYGNK
ncbi:MAG: sigma-70 family RNA polymerase sigma factor [Tannerella sp.]|jgi:RNA polymerase sigma-70 factor (ECF subfamily)|nr:sigma-70 family RNA polymerase sigma factor [Tannerella sp.]